MAGKFIKKPKVTFSDFSPKRVPLESYEKAPVTVGYIIGQARRVHRKIDSRDQKEYVGLAGVFKSIPGNFDVSEIKERDGNMSGLCYMPEAFLEPIVQELEDGANDGVIVNFMYRVKLGLRGKDGYEWLCEDVMPVEATADDPLSALENRALAAIAAPVKPATPAAKPAAAANKQA